MTISVGLFPQRTKCEIYTRVMGYYRPVSQFNIGKKSEFYSRTYFVASAEQTQELYPTMEACSSEVSRK